MTKGAQKIGGNTRKLTAVSQLQLGLNFPTLGSKIYCQDSEINTSKAKAKGKKGKSFLWHLIFAQFSGLRNDFIFMEYTSILPASLNKDVKIARQTHTLISSPGNRKY